MKTERLWFHKYNYDSFFSTQAVCNPSFRTLVTEPKDVFNDRLVCVCVLQRFISFTCDLLYLALGVLRCSLSIVFLLDMLYLSRWVHLYICVESIMLTVLFTPTRLRMSCGRDLTFAQPDTCAVSDASSDGDASSKGNSNSSRSKMVTIGTTLTNYVVIVNQWSICFTCHMFQITF